MTAINNPFDILAEQLQRLEVLILELKSSSQYNAKIADQIGGIELAEKVTGLARSTIYAMVSKREIPFFKRPGTKRLYFSSDALLQWIREGKKQTKNEVINDYMNK